MDDSVGAPPPTTGGRRPSVFQDIHVSGIITIILEISLLLENLLPLLVVVWWKRPGERTVGDKLIAALCINYILSALIPTPLGLVSYFHGSWFGGKAACECFQVTTSWCGLSSMALVTYICVDRHQTLCPCVSCKVTGECRENFGIVLMFLYTLTLVIATLPVVGLGPEVMKGNQTCDSWIIFSPSSSKRQIYFIAFLTFGYMNIAVTMVSSTFLIVVLNKPHIAEKLRKQEGATIEESESQLLRDSRSAPENSSWLVLALVLLNQVTWIPPLVMITVQKVGLRVSEAAMMYALLATSLPGLLNPLLYGLCLESYREGYKKILLKVFICCRPKNTQTQEMRAVGSSRRAGDRHWSTRQTLRGGQLITEVDSAASLNPILETESISDQGGQRAECQGYCGVNARCQDGALISNMADMENDFQSASGSYEPTSQDVMVPSTSDIVLSSSCSSEECLLESDDSNRFPFLEESTI